MKIVLLTNILSPYRKVFYDKLNHAFQERGIDFCLLVMASTEPDRNWHYEDYKGDYSELLRVRTITVHHICIHFNQKLAKRLHELKPDILIASGSYISPSVLQAIYLKKKLKYKLFFWSESHLDELRNYNCLMIRIRELIRGVVYHKFDGFWYAGSKSLDFIRKYAGSGIRSSSKEYYLIPNLVDHKFYKKASELDDEVKDQLKIYMNIPAEHYVFVLPARLTKVKGIIPFIKLFTHSVHKEKATILIMGDGELKDEIEQLIHSFGLDIRLLGFVKQEDILCYYSIADCFLLPSLSDPNPLSCIEALWAKLPLLVSEHVGNYPETVKIGQNGYIFSYQNPGYAIQLIDRMINSSNEWRLQAKEVSGMIAIKHFDPDKAVEHLAEQMLQDKKDDKPSR